MPVANAHAFLEVLEKSQLVSTDRLEKLRSASSEFPDAKAAAVRLVKEGALTRWQAEQLIRGRHDLSVGKYQKLSQLGSGRTGQDFLARHAELARHVAPKMLPRRAGGASTTLDQLLAEARPPASVDRPA